MAALPLRQAEMGPDGRAVEPRRVFQRSLAQIVEHSTFAALLASPDTDFTLCA